MQANNFEEYLIKKGYTKETVKTYAFQVNPYKEAYPELKNFTFKDVKESLSSFVKNIQSQNYKNTILCSIKKYFDYLLETGQRNDHPCRTMRFKAVRKKNVVHSDLFTSAELELLMERHERYPALRKRNQIITSLLIYQGLQSQEIVNLKLQHIHLDEGKIYVKETSMGTRRHLEMHPKQYKIFESYISETRKDLLKTETDLLLIGIRGMPVTKDDVHYVIQTMKPLFPDRNLSPETIRQSVVANWINEKRFPLEQVQLMAGHRWISTTVKYRQTPQDERRLIINRLHPLG